MVYDAGEEAFDDDDDDDGDDDQDWHMRGTVALSHL